jgi:hypothetical protein
MCTRAAVKEEDEEELKQLRMRIYSKPLAMNEVDAGHDRACGLPCLRIDVPPPTRVDGIQNQYPLENLGKAFFLHPDR